MFSEQEADANHEDGHEATEAGKTAANKAEAALRKLTPEELEGMKARLNLNNELQGEEILSQAVPILAVKIQAREAAQRVGRSAGIAAEYTPGKAANTSPTPRVQIEDQEGVRNQGDWVGEDGVERGWVGEKGHRRWVGAPGEKPPRQRHANREPEAPLGPGQRAYFATCPRY